MKRILAYLFDKKNEVVVTSIILMFVTQIGNAFNYFFQFAMVRLLPVKAWAEFGSLLSFLLIVAASSSVILSVVCKYVSQFKANNEDVKIKVFVLNSAKTVIAFSLTVCIAIFISRGFIAGYLNMSDTRPIVILSFIIFFSFLYPVFFGAAQGLQKFFYIGITSLIPSFLKFSTGILLVYLGFGLVGALGGYLMASFFMVIIPAIPMFAYFKKKGDVCEKHTKEILKYILPVALATQTFAVINYIDVFMVKHYLIKEEAGLYAALTVLGRIILFFPGPVGIVLFPKVAEAYTLKKDTTHLLAKGLLVTFLICFPGVVIFYFFPELMIKILCGAKYIYGANLLIYFGLAMLFYALTTIMMMYNLACHHTKFIYTFVVGAVLQVCLIGVFHETAGQVIKIVLLNGFLLLMINLLIVFYPFKKIRGENQSE